MATKVKGVVIPEMQESGAVEDNIPKSSFLKFTEHKAKVEQAMK